MLLSSAMTGEIYIGIQNLKKKNSYILRMKKLKNEIGFGLINKKRKLCFLLLTTGILRSITYNQTQDRNQAQDIQKLFRKINEGETVTVSVEFKKQLVRWKVGEE